MLPSGPASVRARPPLTVTTAEADEAVSILRRALAGV
jgi:4-aminobutyrate aminotransferase-like enzyme